MMREQIKKLMLGNGLAQLLQFGSILILSRIYQPSDFGLLAQVQSIAMIASIIITLQLHLTIPLAKSNDHAQEKVQLIQILSISIFSLALMPAIWNGESALFALLLSLSLGLINTYTGYLVYSGNFGKMSIFYVARALLIIVMQISFAYAGFKNGLVIATLVGEALSALYLGFLTVYNANKIKWQLVNLTSFVFENKPFSFYGTIQEMISVSAFYAPLLLFTAKYGEEIGGQYAMASRLVWAPVILVSGSYTQVLYHKFGKAPPVNGKDILSLMPKWWIILCLVVGCILAFEFNKITLLLIGDEWGYASLMIPILGIWGGIFFLSTPCRVLIRVFKIQRRQLLIDFGMMLAFILLYFMPSIAPIPLLCFVLSVVFFQNLFLIHAAISQMNKMREQCQ